MKKLRELTMIATRIKINRIEILGAGSDLKYGTQMQKLYDGIINEAFDNDLDACVYIYGTESKLSTYKELKKSLISKLINTVLFVDVADYHFNNTQRIFYESQRIRGTVNILLARGAKTTAIYLAEQLIKKAIKYDFTEIVLEMANHLRSHYRRFNIIPKKEKSYHNLVQTYQKRLTAEYDIMNNYDLIIKEFLLSKNSTLKLEERVKEYIHKLKEVSLETQSYKFCFHAHLIFTIEHELTKNYPELIATSKSAINYFKSQKEIASKNTIDHFNLKLLSAYIPLKKFEEGAALAEEILNERTEGTINWFTVLEHYFLLCLHTTNYSKAFEIYRRAITHKLFKNLNKQQKELWYIYEAYISYLIEIGKLPQSKERKRKFRLNRFLNEVPVYSKDKKGLNISIIVIQILFLIARGKENQVMERTDSLQMYVHKHLRNDDSLRSNCFIKILLKMVKYNFHEVATLRGTQKLRSTLKRTPIATKGHSQYVEIIPYETLWEINKVFLHKRAYG